ncbi:MAG: uracil-DNA glycosylase [Defluviitaleaceae bacterium]|nr:uracil-DNA glycosylase [Defluviitaleaceae bacterium]
MVILQNDWDEILAEEFQKEYYKKLRIFLKEEYQTQKIYPSMHDIFNALKLTAYKDVKAVIVGQDPYINPGEAHGLSFSVMPGAKTPPSLANIFKELVDDVGIETPENGHLERWARQGVLLLNNVLTVRAKQSRSHANKGWEQFTDAILGHLAERQKPVVFLLWGKDAQTKGRIVTARHHLILQAPHPSPLARGAFFGCKHFSKTNAFLNQHNMEEIQW